MKNKSFQKCLNVKTIADPVTQGMLSRINNFALKPLTTEEVYVRKFLMAHNAVDRDNERFPEGLLDDFAATFPGKALLVGHDRSGPGKGLFFDASTEEMTPDQFTALTGESVRLPEGIANAKVLWAWAYMLQQFNGEIIANLDAGIYRHASIGFRASDLNPVKGAYDNTLFWEYVPPGEALEGSIVWLGAQPGASAKNKSPHELDEGASGASEKDYTKDNPLTPEKGPFKDTTSALSPHRRGGPYKEQSPAFQGLYEEPSGRDYLKNNNPLTPKRS